MLYPNEAIPRPKYKVVLEGESVEEEEGVIYKYIRNDSDKRDEEVRAKLESIYNSEDRRLSTEDRRWQVRWLKEKGYEECSLSNQRVEMINEVSKLELSLEDLTDQNIRDEIQEKIDTLNHHIEFSRTIERSLRKYEPIVLKKKDSLDETRIIYFAKEGEDHE